MNFEKKQPINLNPEEKIIKEKPSTDTEITEAVQEKPVSPYSEFTENEKAVVIKGIIEEASALGYDTEGKQIDFPTDQEKIEEFTSTHCKHFETKRLVDLALKSFEFAPKMVEEITRRGDYSQLERILRHHKDGSGFEYCVRAIEANLKGNEMDDKILMALSESLAKDGEGERVAFEKFSQHMFERSEKAARKLSTYLDYLRIDDEEAKKLLDKKDLLLIGGGIAPIKDGLMEKEIDCQVTNIEPLLTNEHKGNSDRPIAENFYDVNAEEIGKHDEVWSANNSLPTYAFNPDQVKLFYQKALQAVKPGGYLRILPAFGFNDSITPAMRLNRVPTNNESIRNIDIMKQRPDLFEVEEFETPPLKSFFGIEKTMKGVNIKVIGDQESVDAFIEDLDKKK